MKLIKKILSLFKKFFIANMLVFGAILGKKMYSKEKPQEKNISSDK